MLKQDHESRNRGRMTDDERARIRKEARAILAQAARRLRALRGTAVERELDWQPDDGSSGWSNVACYAHVGGGGRLYLQYPSHSTRYDAHGCIEWISPRPTGVHYLSRFGENSDKSFSGYLPGLTLEEAKRLVWHDAYKHW